MNKKTEIKLFSNMLYNALYRCVYVLFPLITVPYLSRILLADGVGKVNFAISIVNYFLIFASLGIPQYGIREIAKKRNSNELSNTFMEIFSINFISTSICLFIYYIMIFEIPYFENRQSVMIAIGFLLLFNLIKVDWFFQGIEEYKYIAGRSIFIKILSVLLMFIFVKNPNDVVKYAYIYVFALGGNDIFNIFYINKFITWKPKHLSIKKHLSPIIILVSSQLAINIYTNLDITMIGIFVNDSSVGIYSNASKIVKLITTVVISVCAVLLPRLSSYYAVGEFQKINTIISTLTKALLFISIPMTSGIMLLSNELTTLFFGSGFIGVSTTMKILAPLISILSIGNLFGTQVLMTFNREKDFLITVIIGASINFGLNLILIPLYHENGAAIASVVAELLVLFFQIFFAIKYVKVNINLKFIFQLIFSNMLLSAVVCIILNTEIYDFYKLILAILLSAILYFAVNLLWKNEILILVLKKVLKNK